MCIRIFIPTPRKLLLFLILLLLTISGILVSIPPLQHFLGLASIIWYFTTMDAANASVLVIITQIIYSYILACLYAFGYVWLEANIRRRYPHMNDIVKKRQEPKTAPILDNTISKSLPARRKKPAKKPGKR